MPAKNPNKRPTGRPTGATDRRAASNGLGSRLRLARERTGMSLRELARRVGVSASLVSQIERDRVKPSVGTLYSVANELGLLLDELFRDGEPGPNQHAKKRDRGQVPAAVPDPVQRHSGRKTIRLASGVRWERLTSTPDKDAEFLYVVYDVGSASCDEHALTRHGGKEYAYMISGRLGVRIGFEEYELRPGDSISFDAQSPHRLWTIGREPAVAIWVVLNRHSDSRARRKN
jgi:transcriptional regulator with XRE-family HTH domain